MPTRARIWEPTGLPVHIHSLGDRRETEWHYPWHTHTSDPTAHIRDDAGTPIWVNHIRRGTSFRYFMPDEELRDQYRRMLSGEKLGKPTTILQQE